MPEGRIVKALSGYYYVQSDGTIIKCRARGLFKKHQQSPLVGDWVTFDLTENKQGYIKSIHPRTTELVRPPVANVDQAVIVSSYREPDVQTLLLDKFLVHVEHVGLAPVIAFTKKDLQSSVNVEELVQLYETIGYPVVTTSTVTMDGIDELRELLTGHITVFAGQSGVGKSSLMNALVSEHRFETGEVSKKLGRGRHTTRHVEMVQLSPDSWVVDTPGFSQLSFQGWEPHWLTQYFPEFRKLEECHFRGCLHDREPRCAVKMAVERKAISQQRYEHYLQFLTEIGEQRRF